MKGLSTKKVVLGGLFMALICVTTMFTRIPLPKGYFNLGDVFVMLSAVFLGKYYGFLVGGIGSAMADMLTASYIYAPVTLVIKGFEAFATAAVIGNEKGTLNNMKTVAAVSIGSFIMFTGYFIAEAFLFRLLDESFGVAVAVINVPANVLQGCLSGLSAFLLLKVLKKTNLIAADHREG